VVVGFSRDASIGDPALANHNIAKAGGSVSAHLADREDDLDRALEDAIDNATRDNAAACPTLK
jgi:hypothetical protein